MSNKIYWVGCFPDNSKSIGDQAQTLATQDFFYKFFSDYVVLKFNRDEIGLFFKSIVDKDDLIFIHSSGDFGDLYERWHNVRKSIINRYPNNLIIQLPVSVYYGNACNFERDKIFFSNKPNFLLLVRSQVMADRLEANFSCHVKYFPDFVYSLQIPKIKRDRRGVLLVLRFDNEYVVRCLGWLLNIAKRPLRFIGRFLGKDLNFVFNRIVRRLDWCLVVSYYWLRYFYIDVSDVQVYNGEINAKKRVRVVYSVLDKYRRVKLVISDRFHALVFAYLVNTPSLGLKGRIKQKTEIVHPVNIEKLFSGFREMMFQTFKENKLEAKFSPCGVLDVVKRRRSIRCWSDNAPFSNIREMVLEAGVYSPSGSNTQSVRFISIVNKKIISKLCQFSSEWFKNSFPSWIIVILVDSSKVLLSNLWLDRFVWQDSSSSIMSMMLVAEDVGLNSCWASVTPDQANNVRGLLNISDRFIVCSMLFLGYGLQNINLESGLHQGRLIKRDYDNCVRNFQ